jgi:gamma-tubulin complex component 3
LLGKKGGSMISAVEKVGHHGDKLVIDFVDRIMRVITQPFYKIIESWIYSGELLDPYNEFFVASTKNANNANLDLWNDKYELVKGQIPTFIGEDLARKAFLIGKSLNFIRSECKDPAWVEKNAREHSKRMFEGYFQS